MFSYILRSALIINWKYSELWIIAVRLKFRIVLPDHISTDFMAMDINKGLLNQPMQILSNPSLCVPPVHTFLSTVVKKLPHLREACIQHSIETRNYTRRCTQRQ